jgi:glycosyltransferase involved in cell wall biosynthesis
MTSGDVARICYLGNAASVHLRRWAVHFARRGYEVHVISVDPPGEEIRDVTVHYLGRGRAQWGVSRWFRYIGAVPRVRALLRWLQPDILHAHYATGYGLLGSLAGSRLDVISVWGSDVLSFPRRSPLHAALVKLNLGRADWICSTSHYMAREVRKYTNREVIVTPFGVDVNEFGRATRRADCEEAEVIIGTVRSLERGYGIEYLIQAFAALCHRRLPCSLRLLIVGAGSQRTRLERLAKTLGIENKTEFVGWIPHHRVPDYLRRMAIFVAPSVHEESFGVAVLEASAAGLPVVASRVGGLPEVVEDGKTGLLVAPGESASLADALERLVTDVKLRRTMGEAGMAFVREHYDWQRTAQVVEDLYERILSARREG